MKKYIYRVSSVLLLGVLLSAALSTQTAWATATDLVTTRTELLEAIHAAGDGDTIHVGDIDFHDHQPVTGVINTIVRVTVDKSLTLRGAKPDGSKSVLSGGSFIIDGPQAESQRIHCAFENITFDGGIDGSALVIDDWDLTDDMDLEPRKVQFAASFLGNVDATFTDCYFMHYMHPEGGALRCDYGDYETAQVGDFLYDYRDNRYCSLTLSLNNCVFSENTAYYAGGALYLDGGGRIKMNAGDCVFSNNNTSVGRIVWDDGTVDWVGVGGGAIFAQNADVTLTDCNIADNTANRVYSDAFGDVTKGGGIHISQSTLAMTGCVIEGNRASKGGGIYLAQTQTSIDNCDISENRAASDATVYLMDYIWDSGVPDGPPDRVVQGEQKTGMDSGLGFGGGVYMDMEAPVSVEFLNTSIVGNSAQNAYGGFFAYFNEWLVPLNGFGRLDFVFCTYADNRCESDYSHITDRVLRSSLPAGSPSADNIIWETVPGDVWEITYASPFGCVIVDEDFGAAYTRHGLPSEVNGYNYFGSPQQADNDNVLSGNESRPVFEIPSDIMKTVFGGRFAEVGGRLYAGRNDILSPAKEGGMSALVIVLIVLGVAAFVGGFLIILRRGKLIGIAKGGAFHQF